MFTLKKNKQTNNEPDYWCMGGGGEGRGTAMNIRFRGARGSGPLDPQFLLHCHWGKYFTATADDFQDWHPKFGAFRREYDPNNNSILFEQIF